MRHRKYAATGYLVAVLILVSCAAARAQIPGARLVTAHPFFMKTWTTTSYVDFRVHAEKQGAPSDHEVFVEYGGAPTWTRVPLALEGDYGDHLTFTGRLQGLSIAEFRVGCRMPNGVVWYDDNSGQHYKISAWNMSYPPYMDYTLGAAGNTVGLIEAQRTYTVTNGWPFVGLKGKIAVQALFPVDSGTPHQTTVHVHIKMGGAWAVVPAHYVSTLNVEPGSPGHVQIWEFDAPWTINPWIAWQFWLPLEFEIVREWNVNGSVIPYVDDNFACGYLMEFGVTDRIQ
ncbi:MAG: hypothetical protein KA248_06200 [Kiritimatiellae bacterium]|nr:hypothetical protein [Kiritimatiellia bacterium]